MNIRTLIKNLTKKAKNSWIERVQQETLLEVVSDPILGVDLEGSPLFYNSPFALLLGKKNVKNRRLWKMFIDQEILKAFQTALKKGKTDSIRAIPFDLPTGRQFFSVNVTPLRKANGKVYGAVAIFHDVTDLKRAEQIRIDFVANVSHELRTPLTAIKGYTDTLIQDFEQGKSPEREFFEVISRNADRLMVLISDLLDLSSLESTDVIHKIELSTEDVTERILKQMQGVLDAKKQEVLVTSISKTVLADARRLEQVLVNLLDNANKYTSMGGKISVTWESEDDQGTLLKVVDSGPGIPLVHQTRLFERFYRVDKARSREVGGTGLGLAIVKHIMQRHQGSVWVESAPGKGASFICHFPN